MADKEPGYVYILTNPSFKEDWVKIGKSSRPVDVRSKELDNTAVPLPFDIFATMKTVKYNEAEKLVHQFLDRFTDRRIRRNREFFNVTPEEALSIFKMVGPLLDDAEITIKNGPSEPMPSQTDNKPVSFNSKGDLTLFSSMGNKVVSSNTGKKQAFKFSQAGIQVGEYVIFDATGETVKVVSDDSIEYKGKKYSLTGFVKEYYPKVHPTKTTSFRGPMFFSYHGKKLTDLREEKERYDAY